MICVILFLLTFQLLLVDSASLGKDVLDEEVCESKECYYAATHIKKWMNPAFKPCEDFYEFSCGYWHNPDNTTKNKVDKMSVGSRDMITNFHLKNFILDEDIAEESRLFKMLKQFFTLCLDEESIETRGVSPAIEALKKAGGWPLLQQDWSEDNWRFEDIKIAFGRGAFFDIRVIPSLNWTLGIDFMMPDYRLLFEDPSGEIKNKSMKKYFEKSCALAVELGADKSKAEEDMREVVEFETAIAELVLGRNISYEKMENITLTELQGNISWVDWDYLLTKMLPESVSITKNDVIKIFNLQVLKDMGNIISSYPKRTIANYVMWKAALTLTKYLPIKIRKIINSEEDHIYENRYDQCVVFAKDSSLLGALATYIARETVDDTKAARDITQNILNELLIEISELDWLDEKTRSTAIEKLRETTILISFPEEATDLNVIEDIYKEVKINTSYFFEAMMDSNRWLRKSNLERLGSSTDLGLQDKLELALTIAAYFNTKTNTIVVAGGFLHFIPLFSSKVPAYVNYGHLGSIVAHELTHALDFQTDENDDTDNRVGDYLAEHLMERWGSNVTEAVYDGKKQCIIDQYSSFNDSKYTRKKLNGNQTVREDVADNGGFKIALQAYRRMASNLITPEPRLPTLHQYSPEQVFIISLANAQCEIPSKMKRWSQLQEDSHSPFEFRVKGMMMNSPDFSELFNCQKGDPMNPVEKCEVW